MEEYNPEKSPFFSHYRYDGNALQRRLKVGKKTPIFKTELHADIVDQWAEREGTRVLAEFADANPDFEVVTGFDEKGAKKTITLPFWARDRARALPQSYYKKSSWVFRCVDIKAKSIAGLDWAIYPGIPEDDNVEALPEDNEAVKLLREVNPDDNWADFIAKVSKDLDLYGKAYIWKIRSGSKIVLLKRLNPSTMRVEANEEGIKSYVQLLGGERKVYEKEDIMYLRDYDPDDDTGSISPLESCKSAVQVEIAANSHLTDYFENNAMPALIMSSPADVSDKDLKTLTGMYKREFGTSGKRGKTAFMSHGFEPKQLSYPLNQLALTEVREESRKAICGAFGVPTTLAGATEAANFATMNDQRKSLYSETIIPRARYIEGVFNAELMAEMGDKLFFRFEYEGVDVLQDDMGEKAAWLALFVQNQVIKPEVAAVEMGFEESDVPEPKPEQPLEPQGGNLRGSGQAPQAPDVQLGKTSQKSETAQAEIIIDLNKWRRKCINRIRRNQTAFCTFESDHIPEILTNLIETGLMNADTVDDVHDVFNGAHTKTKDKAPVINVDVNVPEREVVIENQIPEQTAKEISINVEPTPVNVEAPEVNIETKVEAPEVQVVNPKIDVNVPKVVYSEEEQQVDRGMDKLIKGSKTTTTYTYDDETD